MEELFKLITKKNNSKIDVNDVKDRYAEHSYNVTEMAIKLDNLKILRSIFSENLPQEISNGLINLDYVMLYPNATSEEIESALVMR